MPVQSRMGKKRVHPKSPTKMTLEEKVNLAVVYMVVGLALQNALYWQRRKTLGWYDGDIEYPWRVETPKLRWWKRLWQNLKHS